PGDEEDERGKPFVGPAGTTLDAALAEAASAGSERPDACRSELITASDLGFAPTAASMLVQTFRSGLTSAVDGTLPSSRKRWICCGASGPCVLPSTRT